MNGFTKRVMSVFLAVSSVLAPLGQSIGFRVAVVGSAAVLAPPMAFAQKGHRLCGAIMKVYDNRFGGVMMEVNKGDFVTCGSIVMSATGQYAPSAPNLRNAINYTFKAVFHGGFPESHIVSRLAPCEEPTSWWFPPGAFGGDVCKSMKDYTLYRFWRYTNGSYSISR